MENTQVKTFKGSEAMLVDNNLTDGDKIVGMYLISKKPSNDETFCLQAARIAVALNKNPRTITRNLKALQDQGYIEIDGHSKVNNKNIYKLNEKKLYKPL